MDAIALEQEEPGTVSRSTVAALGGSAAPDVARTDEGYGSADHSAGPSRAGSSREG